ncbi:Nitrogen permease regulator-like 2 [Desmophyllum pertusum]|uniref:Nitrogen permease regulator-like 2 n=1 Tax=Desmophyllum pertusum TaxID=174260 RepID=A0A9X0D064_9CNID|nr:Nitrogen permease regulator-like 2 [Desmophyllum pertusum]
MLTGVIRRLHKYPVQLTTPSKTTSSIPRSHHRLRGRHRDSEANRFKLADKWLDGNHNYDEICCKTGIVI